jgi:micrococcal nuclease
LCVEREVARVIDGDTLEVEGGLRIRLVLVDAPELDETGGPEATEYLTSLCLGKRALVDEDDDQIGDDPYGRVLAVTYCGGANANAAMISSGRAQTYYDFCSASEFGNQAWTGCSSQPPPPSGECDPAYPEVCILPPPPDLDCADIPYRNFRVQTPDPHRFDGDGDGIGCES